MNFAKRKEKNSKETIDYKGIFNLYFHGLKKIPFPGGGDGPPTPKNDAFIQNGSGHMRNHVTQCGTCAAGPCAVHIYSV